MSKITSLLIISSALLLLSACNLKSISNVPAGDSIKPVPTLTDDQMIKDLNSDTNFNIDQTTDQLNSELK